MNAQKVTDQQCRQIKQADVDAGAVDNSATATGNPPTGEPVVSEPSEVNIAATQSPAITLPRSAR